MSQITIGGTTLNFKDSAFTGDQWEQVASWVLNGGAEGIDANAQIATEKAAAAAASAAAARNSAKSAGESASAAASSAAKAANYNSGAQSSANRAAASATNAASSERNAASSAATADSAKYSAESAAKNAANSQSAAKQSENHAKTYESSARLSATQASTYASSAAESIKHAPRINSDGKWELWDVTQGAYVATEYTAIGKDGTTPHIGANGNWYIGDTDTGVKAAIVYYVDISGTNDDITGSKTFAEIKAAYEANNVVVARQNIAIYVLTYISDTRAEFTRVDATGYTVWACSNSGAPSEADIWQFSNTKRVNYDTKYRDIGLKTVPGAIKELQDKSSPAVTDADAGKYLHVNASTKKLEWAEAGGGTSLTKDSIVTALGYTPLNPSVDNVTLAVDGTHGLSLSSAYSMGLDITADMARMNMSPVGRGAVASPNPAIKFKGDASPTADFGNDKDVILTGIADGTEDNDAATVRQLKEYVASESPGWTGGDMIMMRDGDGFVGYAEMKPDTVGAMPVVPVNDAAKGKYLHVNASKELEWAGLSFTDDGSGNISVDGATEQSVNRFLQSLTFPGLNFKYINPLNSGTYSNPYGVYVGSGASLVDTILTKTVPGVYTVYMNRNATDVPAAAAAASSSLRGLVILSQIKKHYAIIMLVDQLSNFYVQYIQNDVGGGWKQMPTSDGGSDLPAVTAADAGKFLRVSSSGFWAAETVANANGGEF